MLDQESAGTESANCRIGGITPIDCVEEPKISPQPRKLLPNGSPAFE